MNNREVDKIKLPANRENSRLNLYAGSFDLVNGKSLPRRISDYLKFAALFYERIVIPDGFLHCYGPLTSYFEKYISDRGSIQQLDIVRLLKAGILVPALRRGESIYENWKAGENIGITPGEYLILSRKDPRLCR